MRSAFSVIASLLLFSATAQSSIIYKGENINELDQNNNKIGIWKIFDEKNDRSVAVEFTNGVETSSTKYYNAGNLFAERLLDGTIKIYKSGSALNYHWIKDKQEKWILADDKGSVLDYDIQELYENANAIQPLYYGGPSELYALIIKNLKKGVVKNSARIVVRFDVDINGFITNPEILNNTDNALAEEMARILTMASRWQPGYQNGKFVKVKYSLPIIFK